MSGKKIHNEKRNVKAVFLDRDGTINEEVSYLSRIEDIKLIPGSCEGIKRLVSHGFKVIVVTNQSGVARGYFDETRVREINRAIGHMLEECGALVHGWYYCPHHPDGTKEEYRLKCSCRKPAPGLIKQAADDMGIDCAGSFMVGDSPRDIEAGITAGCRPLLVRTGYGDKAYKSGDLSRFRGMDIHVFDDLNAASYWIVDNKGD